jgi:hypothetical protein
VHEAFAQPFDANPGPSPAVPQEPPPAVPEELGYAGSLLVLLL